MIRRGFIQRFPAAVLLVAVAGAAAPAAAADSRLTADGRIPVVFHVTNKDPLMWNQSLNNAANYQRAMGKDKLLIEIVVNGPGIGMLLAESEVEPRVTAALSNGVKIVACEETMKGAKLTKEIVALEKRVHEMAANAKTATDIGTKVAFYGEYIGGCAGCHALHGKMWGPGLPKTQ